MSQNQHGPGTSEAPRTTPDGTHVVEIELTDAELRQAEAEAIRKGITVDEQVRQQYLAGVSREKALQACGLVVPRSIQ